MARANGPVAHMAQPCGMRSPIFEPSPLKVEVKNTFIDIVDDNNGYDDIEDILANGGINTRRQFSEPARFTSTLQDAPLKHLSGLSCTYSGLQHLLGPLPGKVAEGVVEGDVEEDLALVEDEDLSNESPEQGSAVLVQPMAYNFNTECPDYAGYAEINGASQIAPHQSSVGPVGGDAGCGNVAGDESSEWANVTTVMMRHLSNQYTQRVLLEEIDSAGFNGKYDFLYLPIDPTTGRNKGYAFINFCDPGTARMFRHCYDGQKMNRFMCSKVVSVTPAALQGFDANYAHYSMTRVTRGDPAARPLFLREPTTITSQAPRRRGGRARRGGRGSAIDQAVAQRQRELEDKQRQQPPQLTSEGPGSREIIAEQHDGGFGGTATFVRQGFGVAPPAASARPSTQGTDSKSNNSVRPKFCTSCGTPVQPHYKFCESCGNPLRSVIA